MEQGNKTVLTFWFLVERRDSERWNTSYRARSILTGNVAEARTVAGAIENLKKTIDAAIHGAGRHELSPNEWWVQAQSREMRRPETIRLMELFAKATPLAPLDSRDMHAKVAQAA